MASLVVICLEGCHGSGKTELCKILSRKGYNVLDEDFMDMPECNLHPQSFVMETLWVARWFERILIKQWELGTGRHVYISDRSPLSAAAYAADGGSLIQCLIEKMERELKNVRICHVMISVDKDLLWDRISKRLITEPEREKYKEGDRAWMNKVLGFYEKQQWHSVVWNHGNREEAVQEIEMIASLLP